MKLDKLKILSNIKKPKLHQHNIYSTANMAGNCKTDLQATESCKRHAKNQLGTKRALERVHPFL